MNESKQTEMVWVVTDEDGVLVDVCSTYEEAYCDSSKNDFIQGFAPVTERTLANVSKRPAPLTREPGTTEATDGE
jgi:hypothetical protein